MRLKPRILRVAGTVTHRQIAEDFELSGDDKRKRQVRVEVISNARRCQPEDLLGSLDELKVKLMCKAIGVASKGRKNALITRLLDATSSPPAPALRRRRHRTHDPRLSTIRQSVEP